MKQVLRQRNKAMIIRTIAAKIKEFLHMNRAIIIYGARRTGKTTLLNSLAEDFTNLLQINCDLVDAQEMFNFRSAEDIRIRFSNHAYLLIDEAQRIPDIGLKLKSIIDTLPKLQIIATSSSSLELSNLTIEPLTGRKFEFILSPLSTAEIYKNDGALPLLGNVGSRLIYDNHPEVYLANRHTEILLKEIAGSYLFRDMLIYQDIKRPDLLSKLLTALALQLGQQVSYSELGIIVGLDSRTIERYIYLLEQSFIIFRLGAYSRNLRNELKRSQKIYFWDNGIRNAVINSFNPLPQRADIGALWENYYISERRKYLLNAMISFEHYFWRTTQKQEIDLIEISSNRMLAVELKWNPAKDPLIPLTFRRAYPEAELKVINRENYLAELLTQ